MFLRNMLIWIQFIVFAFRFIFVALVNLMLGKTPKREAKLNKLVDDIDRKVTANLTLWSLSRNARLIKTQRSY